MPEINKAEIYLEKFSRGSGGLETRSAPPRGLSDVKSKLEALERALALSRQREKPGVAGTRSAGDDAQLLAHADRALTKLANDGAQANLTREEESGLEAVVLTDGSRPSLIIQDNDIDFDDPWNQSTVGSWQDDLEGLRPGIRSLVASVGMFLVNGGTTPAGTGFVIADGLVLTNQHMLESLRQFPGDVVIDFAGEFERNRQKRFRVNGEAFASSDVFNGQLVLPPSKLDVGILRIEGDEATPAPMPILTDASSLLPGFESFVLGFPMTPQSGLSAAQTLATFGNQEFNVKRLSPGQIKEGPSTFQDGNQPSRVFTHDSSTLGGNSGSVVVEMFAGGRHAIGLHFGGLTSTRLNYAHALQRLRPLLQQHGAIFV